MARTLLTTWGDYLAAADALLARCAHSICVFDGDLTNLHWENPQRLALLTTLLSTQNEAPLRVVLRDSRHFLVEAPRIYQTLQTWSHRAQVRQTSRALSELRDAILIVDRQNALIRFEKTLPRSVLIENSPEEVLPYQQRFDEIWQESGKNLLQTSLGL